LDSWPDYVFGVYQFGSGRMTELTLAFICGLYGLILLFAPAQALHSSDLSDLAWAGLGRMIAIPFLVKSVITGIGLARNIRGDKHSRQLRFIGALIGTFIWSWIATNLAYNGSFGALGFPVSVTFTYLSIRIMALACANLPVPGTAGRR
jgi:hypothetical protein